VSVPVPPPDWRQADPEALRGALAEAGGGGSLPGASVTEYLMDLAGWLLERLLELIGGALPDNRPEWLERLVVWGAVGLAGTAALVALWAVWRRRRRPVEGPAVEGLANPPPASSRTADWWWAEAARLLEQGAVRPALAALWWWVARRLDPPGLDETWTTADLLRVEGAAVGARRPLRHVDRLLWGRAVPAREQVESVRGELVEALR
jgi:hypothetical protein